MPTKSSQPKIQIKSSSQKSSTPKSNKRDTPAPIRSHDLPKVESLETKIASDVIHILDQATDVLRKVVTEGACSTAATRKKAQQKAADLLEKAHSFLTQAIEEGSSALKKGTDNLQTAIKKLREE